MDSYTSMQVLTKIESVLKTSVLETFRNPHEKEDLAKVMKRKLHENLQGLCYGSAINFAISYNFEMKSVRYKTDVQSNGTISGELKFNILQSPISRSLGAR